MYIPGTVQRRCTTKGNTLACAATAAVAACASFLHRGETPGPTLLVHNGGAASVDLAVLQGISVLGDTAAYTLGSVFAGETACFRLESLNTPQWLMIKSIGGTNLTLSFIPTSHPAWGIELRGDPKTDALGLQPADDKCEPGARRTSS